jgi:hypothetical protein
VSRRRPLRVGDRVRPNTDHQNRWNRAKLDAITRTRGTVVSVGAFVSVLWEKNDGNLPTDGPCEYSLELLVKVENGLETMLKVAFGD